MSQVEAPSESRFAHLLQPIRDLAANWDIDIANELEDYLDVLESVTFSFEGGHALNFAEAALLIQGSACVYSKKVEYLHTLVFQALDHIAEKNKKATARAERQAGGEDADEFDEEEQFLNLDDVLEEGTGIDLDDSTASSVAPIARPPAALLALEDAGGSGDSETGCYRVASCSVHKSGALLLEARDGDTLDELLRHAPHRPSASDVSSRMVPDAGPEAGPDSGGWGSDDDGDAGGFDHWEAPDGGDAHPGSAEAREGPTFDEDQGAPDRWSGEGNESCDFFDPYEPLDPHATGTLPLKPFQRRASSAPGARGLWFPEFAYALRARQLAEKPIRSRQETAGQQRPAFDPELGAADLDYAEEDGYDRGGYDDFAGPPSDDDEGDVTGVTDGVLGVDVAAEWAELASSGAVTLTLDVDGKGAAPMTYEELCQAHIEAYISRAAAAEVQTELAVRVTTWRDNITPALEQQDARPEFDIHSCGATILDRLSTAEQEEEPADFGAVAREQEQWQVSRLFSALLQLANQGNVEIIRVSDGEQFGLRLQTTTGQHPDFDAFLAPSLQATLGAEEGKPTGTAATEPGGIENVDAKKGVPSRRQGRGKRAKF